jgi:two-component system nitrogen regulation response regulator GlnG
MSMVKDPDDDQTLQGETLQRETYPVRSSSHGTRAALTLLMHPRIERIGDVHVIEGSNAGDLTEVSRLEPDFSSPRTGASMPIREAYTSRQPLIIRWNASGGAELSPTSASCGLTLKGAPLSSPTTVNAAEIERGVPLGLGPNVSALLHRTSTLGAHPQTYGLIGESDTVQRTRQQIERIADMPEKVLIRGETGTGKELIARAIHDASDRSSRPFLAINMANLQPGTAQSQMYGHARGAFSGADQKREGLFGAAQGGTLFLDEIGETREEVQQMLLRSLDGTGTSVSIEPVGESQPRRLDVRIVAATDADLEDAVDRGTFDQAILGRLQVGEIEIAPLRERLEDLGRLLVHFAREVLPTTDQAHRLDPKLSGGKPWLSPEDVARLVQYSWPGNVRELRNAARQIAIHSRGRPETSLAPSLERRLQREVQADSDASKDTQAVSADGSSETTRRPADLTKTEVLDCLRSVDWSPETARKALGISKNSLYALMTQFEIPRAQDLDSETIESALGECKGDLGFAADGLQVSERGLKLRMKALGLTSEPAKT